MAVRRFGLGVVTVVAGVLVSLALLAGSASAALTHPYELSFGSWSSSFVEGVALDGAGNVYTFSAGRIEKFDASGNPVNFSATGTNKIEGLDSTGSFLAQIAVDNSTGAQKGDIYVATGSHVAIFASSGESLGELNGSIESEVPATSGEWGMPCGVAVDKEGDVYVGLSSGHVFKYVPSGNPAVNTDFGASLNGLESVCSLAVDSAGSVYATGWFGGPVHKYEALQFGALQASGTQVVESATAVAVDASDDHVYVDQFRTVSEYDSTGNQVTVSEGGRGTSTESHALAAGGDTVYLADDQSKQIDVLGPAVMLPDATATEAVGVTTTSETLHGAVNPDGVPITACRFEYGSSGFTDSAPCSPDPGAGSELVEVSATVTGLTPNTAYKFRVVAENSNGSTAGQPVGFTTLSTPLLSFDSPREVTYESASVEAQIAPMAASASYRIEYGPSAAYGQRAPAAEATIKSSGVNTEYVTVKQPLSGLQPGATYHYRVVATNQYGTTAGEDRILNVPPAPATVADGCANAAIRQAQQASLLPECRAFEMVSPVDKQGGDIAAVPRRTQAAIDGNSIKYTSKTAFGDAIGSEAPGAEYIADRSAEGWATHSINPAQGSVFLGTFEPSSYQALSPDLTKGVFFGRTPVLAGHPNVERVSNLYLRNDLQTPGAGDYELLSDAVSPLQPPKGLGTKPEILFDAASADWSRIIFESDQDLTANTAGMSPSHPKVYEWHNGVVEFIGILPDSACGTPPCLAEESIGGNGAGISNEGYWTKDSISADGSRIVFEGGPLSSAYDTQSNSYPTLGDLYMRTDKTTTIQVNASERTERLPDGHQARFVAATADDSKVFFETSEELTDGLPPLSDSEDAYLYRYDLEAPVGKRLTLIAPEVDRGPAPAISEDGSFVYFLANRVPGQPVPEGYAKARNLFVWHDGTIHYVAFRRGSTKGEGPRWGESGSIYPLIQDEFRMSADGRKIVFASTEPADARRAGVRNDNGHVLMFVYDYDTGKLTCISCDPSGEQPTSNAQIEGRDQYGTVNGLQYLSNAMTRDGRYVFFDTGDPLVPQDVNGRYDVYEYDTVTGELYLLSDGRCGCDTTFVDATPDGSDVFFTTRQRLVAADRDTELDLYDVRVNGGIAVQNQAPAAACAGEECRGPAGSAPVFSVPSSATFVGEGNPKPGVSTVHAKRKHPTLGQALKACKHKPKRKRAKCRARLRKAYHVNRAAMVKASRRAGL